MNASKQLFVKALDLIYFLIFSHDLRLNPARMKAWIYFEKRIFLFWNSQPEKVDLKLYQKKYKLHFTVLLHVLGGI